MEKEFKSLFYQYECLRNEILDYKKENSKLVEKLEVSEERVAEMRDYMEAVDKSLMQDYLEIKQLDDSTVIVTCKDSTETIGPAKYCLEQEAHRLSQPRGSWPDAQRHRQLGLDRPAMQA